MSRLSLPPAVVYLFWAALAVYLAVLPVSDTIALRNLAFLGLLLCTAYLLLQQRLRPEFPCAWAWALYALVALVSVSYAVDPGDSLREVKTELLYGAAIFALAATWGRWRGLVPGLAVLLALSNAVMVGFCFWYVSYQTPAQTVARASLRAGIGTFSTYVVTVLPLLAYLAWRLWQERKPRRAAALALLLAANLGALLLTFNRQSLLAVAVAVVLVGVLLLRRQFTRRRLAALLGVVALLATLLGVQVARRIALIEQDRAASQLTERWYLWNFVATTIAERPFSGGGFGREAFRKLHPEYPETHPQLWHAHNMVLNKGVQMGLPGMAAFLLLWLALAREFSRYLNAPDAPRRELALCGIALVCAVFLKNMTDDFFVRDGALLFWLLAGALLGSLRRLDQQDQQDQPEKAAG